MKQLFILRHAKSSWDDPALADFDRPLNDRGLRAAPFMGKLMAERGFVPDAIISSPARRAIHTAELVRHAGGFDAPVALDQRIYEATVATLGTVISEIGGQAASALIVGHNPGMEGLVWYLTGEDRRMPTAALACISLNIDDWDEIGRETGVLDHLIRPKQEMKLARGENPVMPPSEN